MKLTAVRQKTFKATTESALDTAVNDWLKTQGEAHLVDRQFSTDGTNAWVTILYSAEG